MSRMVELDHQWSEYPTLPCQCECGHIFLEKFKLAWSDHTGSIPNTFLLFAWCGFCRTRWNGPFVDADGKLIDRPTPPER